MYEFTPFKKTDKLSYESFIQFPRELLNREEYKVLSPNAMLLYSILTDRLELSFKQIESNKKIQFYDAKGDMYVIFKREEIQDNMDEIRLYEMYLNEAIEERKSGLLNKNPEYQKLKEKFNNIMNNYPKLQLILEEDRQMILDETECKMLQKLVSIYLEMTDFEDKEIFLLVGKEMFYYLKDTGVIKEK